MAAAGTVVVDTVAADMAVVTVTVEADMDGAMAAVTEATAEVIMEAIGTTTIITATGTITVTGIMAGDGVVVDTGAVAMEVQISTMMDTLQIIYMIALTISHLPTLLFQVHM